MPTLQRFLPQSVLDGWVDQGKVDPKPDRIVDLANGEEFPMREAVRFVRLESGADASGLVSKVKTLEQVKSMGAEYCMTSVIVGETVYEVVPGWLAEEPVAAAPEVKPASKKFEGKNQEADMLAKLLLDKLS